MEMRAFIKLRIEEAAARVRAARRPELKERAEKALASWQDQLDEVDRRAAGPQNDNTNP